ncbi:MAG TPA: DUF805 domain-containing protein [Bradyrhizobium sp.]|jgi:uncharacterized membrane protein YhaH (DUF805 family)|nr:DUF805 domain-containing protein [Bradyrhizobium sp.]
MDNSYTSNEFLFSFEGRINRAKYWYASFASMISCGVFLGVLAFALGAIFGDSVKSVYLDVHDIIGDPPSFPFRASFANTGSAPTLVSTLFYVLGTPIFIAGMWFVTAATVKRLHDRNRSGWWIILFLVVPPLFNRFDDLFGDSWTVLFLGLFAGVLWYWGLIEMLFLKGTRGPNRFGPDPLAPVDTRPGWDQQDEVEFVPHGAGPSAGPHVKRRA